MTRTQSHLKEPQFITPEASEWFGKSSFVRRTFFAAVLVGCFVITGCVSDNTTSVAPSKSWSANGYLTPGPTGEPDFVDLFYTQADCLKAADAWASQQVVGNPVFTECLPIDHH